MTTLELAEGPRILGHAIGHACAMYGDRVDDYGDTIALALHGRHRAPATLGTIASDYVTTRARQLITEAESGVLDHAENQRARAEWIGAAVAILRELIRDA